MHFDVAEQPQDSRFDGVFDEIAQAVADFVDVLRDFVELDTGLAKASVGFLRNFSDSAIGFFE